MVLPLHIRNAESPEMHQEMPAPDWVLAFSRSFMRLSLHLL